MRGFFLYHNARCTEKYEVMPALVDFESQQQVVTALLLHFPQVVLSFSVAYQYSLHLLCPKATKIVVTNRVFFAA